MKKNRSIVDAVIAAPVPVVMLVVVPWLFTGPVEITRLFGALFMTYLVGMIATLALGVPLFFLLRRMELANKWTAASLGLLVGCAMSIALSWPVSVPWGALARISLAGLLAGLVFWMTWSAGDERPG